MAKNNETTTKFKVDISELKSAMQTARKEIALANSEFKASSSAMSNWSKSTDGISAKLKQLNSNLKSQKSVLTQYEKALEEVKAEYGENSKEAQEYQIKLNNQKAVVNKTEKEIEQYANALEQAQRAEKIAATSGEDAAKVFDELGDEAKQAGDKADKSSDGFTVMKGALADLVADGLRLAIDAVKEFCTEVVSVGATFEQSMSKVKAVSGATGDEFEALEKKAQEMGSTTKFTASEAAEAFNYMAMAGWKTEDMLDGIEGIMNLAAASGEDLATTSDIVTDALTAFGMTAEDSGHFADILAAASSNANTNVAMMGETFKYAAPVMGSMGYSAEDAALAIGLMANSGIKATSAGTALRGIITRLAKPTKESAEAIEMLGIKLDDGNGNMLSFRDVMYQIRDGFGNIMIPVEEYQEALASLDEQLESGEIKQKDYDVELETLQQRAFGAAGAENARYAAMLAGKNALSGLMAIVSASDEDFEKLANSIDNCNGTTQKMADTMLDNLAGDVAIAKSALEGLQLEIYKKLQPTFRDFVKYLAKDGVKTLKEIASNFIEIAKKCIPLVKKGIEGLSKVLKVIADNFDKLVVGVLAAIAVFKTFKAIMAISTFISACSTAIAGLTSGIGLATKAQIIWNAAMDANPIGAILAAVGLLIAAISALTIVLNSAKEETDTLSESQRELIDSANESAQAYRDNKQAADELATANKANLDYTTQLWKELEQLADSNGIVTDEEKGRAQFILGELNNALGTEYTMNGNIIESYGEMKQSILDVIEAKKLQILLEGYEDSYREAVQNVAEAEKARAEQAQDLADQQAKATEAEQKALEARAALSEKVANVREESDARALAGEAEYVTKLERDAEKEKQLLEEKETAYAETAASVDEYYKMIDAYEIASTEAASGNTEEAVNALNNLSTGFETVATTAKLSAEEQKKVLEQQVIDTEVNLQLLEQDYKESCGNMTDEEKRQAETRIKNARDQADAAKEEYSKVGGNMVQGMADGSGKMSYVLSDAMKKIVEEAIAAAKKAAEIKSPSRVFKNQVGRYLGLGIAAGIDSSTKDVVKSVKNQIGAIKSAYNVNGLKNIASNTADNLSMNLGSAKQGGVVNNYTQVINSPKQLSRLDIYRQSKNLLGYAGGGY